MHKYMTEALRLQELGVGMPHAAPIAVEDVDEEVARYTRLPGYYPKLGKNMNKEDLLRYKNGKYRDSARREAAMSPSRKKQTEAWMRAHGLNDWDKTLSRELDTTAKSNNSA